MQKSENFGKIDATSAQPVEHRSMTTRERVRQFRQSLPARRRKRFEACVDVAAIEGMTRVAKAFRVPIWRVIKNALAAYCEEFNALIADQRRLRDERLRVAECGSPVQVAAYNQDLTHYNERVLRLLRKPVSPIDQTVKP